MSSALMKYDECPGMLVCAIYLQYESCAEDTTLGVIYVCFRMELRKRARICRSFREVIFESFDNVSFDGRYWTLIVTVLHNISSMTSHLLPCTSRTEQPIPTDDVQLPRAPWRELGVGPSQHWKGTLWRLDEATLSPLLHRPAPIGLDSLNDVTIV